jgi:hypothetical protein
MYASSFRLDSTTIKITPVFVNYKENVLKFYTKKLGFVKKTDMSAKSIVHLD